MLLWFPIAGISLEQDISFEREERTVKLIRRMGIITIGPSAILETNYDLPVAKEEVSMPEIEKSAEELAGDGLVIIRAKFLSQEGRSAMERCSSIIEGLYADQMFQRVQD